MNPVDVGVIVLIIQRILYSIILCQMDIPGAKASGMSSSCLAAGRVCACSTHKKKIHTQKNIPPPGKGASRETSRTYKKKYKERAVKRPPSNGMIT